MLTFLVFTTRHVLYLLDHTFSDNSLSPFALTLLLCPLLNYFCNHPLLKSPETHDLPYPYLLFSFFIMIRTLGSTWTSSSPSRSVHLRQFRVQTSHESVSYCPSVVPAVGWPSSVSPLSSFGGFSTPYLMSRPSCSSSFGVDTRMVYVRLKDKFVSLS